MNRAQFSTTISAPRERVWNTMIAPDTYPLWTAPFGEGSTYEGSWEQGSRIRFLGPGGEGMVAQIAENRPHEHISIRHLGFIKDGVEDTTSDTVRQWAPAYENYTFSDNAGATDVQVDMDVMPEYEDFMTRTWPLALAKLKALCEEQADPKQS